MYKHRFVRNTKGDGRMRRFSNPVEYRTFTGITGSTDLTFEFYLQTLDLEVVEDVYKIILEKVPEESKY